jgi:hypothetical protein
MVRIGSVLDCLILIMNTITCCWNGVGLVDIRSLVKIGFGSSTIQASMYASLEAVVINVD